MKAFLDDKELSKFYQKITARIIFIKKGLLVNTIKINVKNIFL